MLNPDFLVTLTPAQIDEIIDHIDAIEAILPFRVNLTPKQRMSMPKMGIKNYGIVKNVLEAAKANPEAIPAAFPLADFTTRMTLNDDLTGIANRINSLAESVDDTRLAVGSDLMMLKGANYQFMKIGAKGDLPIDSTLGKIAQAHKKKGHAQPAVYSIAASGKLSIENAATGCKLVNNGNTVVMLRPGPGIAFKQSDAKLINPGDSVVVPKGWNSIEITNISQTEGASVAVRLKS